MDAKTEIRECLTSRRARITPDQVGPPTYGSRRVPDPRREELAVLAGVSVPYYTHLERGNMTGVSDTVLSALAGALQLEGSVREQPMPRYGDEVPGLHGSRPMIDRG